MPGIPDLIDDEEFQELQTLDYVENINQGDIIEFLTPDHLSYESLRDLYTILPTRTIFTDHTPTASFSKRTCVPIYHGHHLIYFHDPGSMAVTRQDGTAAINSPSPPFTRRMWAGGKMKWNYTRPEDGLMTNTLSLLLTPEISARLTGWDRGRPMLFLTKTQHYLKIPDTVDLGNKVGKDGDIEPLLQALRGIKPVVEEERTFVYLPPFDAAKRRPVKQGTLTSEPTR